MSSADNKDYFSDSDTNSESDNESIHESVSDVILGEVDENETLLPTIVINELHSNEDIYIESDNESDTSVNENENNNNNIDNTLNGGGPTELHVSQNINMDDDDSDENDDDDDNYLQKFNSQLNNNYIQEYHPECQQHNYEEVKYLTKVVRDSDNIIIDPFHKTQPFLTKYEKTRILGQRSKQIESGAQPFVNVPDSVIDSYIIAELELSQKKIPFIIKRPISNGAFEYWNIKDLEVIYF
jgi:DNA-directed RNA polymerase subunit K/omega